MSQNLTFDFVLSAGYLTIDKPSCAVYDYLKFHNGTFKFEEEKE